ncbi:MAG: T9SS type A sorting domain-containing protein [Ekhidna sp.]|nr:T9SS type A sorting domain-containing protein [Ekhidna sp.]
MMIMIITVQGSLGILKLICSDENLARVVYNGSFLGNNTDENRRSILTHEFGHWLDLRHTFKGGCTEENDLVDDTPAQARSSSGTNCEVIYNCNEEEINNENFMDYTDCYKMFTKGQVERMDAALQLPSRVTLWQEDNLIATGVQGFDEKPSLVLSSDIFEEVFENDGSVSNQIEIKCVDCTFSKTGLFSEGIDYAVSNLPGGLTASIEAKSPTTAVVALTGQSTAHEAENSVTDLEISFTDQAVSNPVSELYSATVKGVRVLFSDAYTSHCLPKTRYITYSHITNFTFNNISRSSEFEDVIDFSDSKIFQASRNQEYDISITLNKGKGADIDKNRIRIWADWDQNFIYSDDELVVSKVYGNDQSDEDGSYQISTSITVPPTALSGDTRIRVFVHHVQGDEGDDACDRVDSGESEDYGLRIYADDQPFTIDFIGGPGVVNFSDPVSFSDLSIAGPGDEIASWEWSFPGGIPAASNERNPSSIIYPSEGTHDVTLKITTRNGETGSKTVPGMITSTFDYCKPSARFGGYFNITHVELNTIDHDPGRDNIYDYFDRIETNLKPGGTYPFSLTVNRGEGGVTDRNRVRIWADWNYNSRFDSYELLLSEVVSTEDYDEKGNHVINGEIKVPLNAVQHKVGLRVMGHFMRGTEGDNPCDRIDSGNSLDYGLNILEADDYPLTVDFSGGPLEIEKNKPVFFSDLSVAAKGDEILSRQWEFPGGVPSTSNRQYPEVRYPDVGIYDVTLTIKTVNGDSKTKTIENMVTASYEYCYPSLRRGGYFNITQVELNTIDHNPYPDNIYDYFDRIETDLKPGGTYPISLTVFKGGGRERDVNRVRVWADWNYNGRFDRDELLLSEAVNTEDYDEKGNHVINGEIKVPLNAAAQRKVRLRVMGHFMRGTEGDHPCDRIDSGNSMDYGLNILEADDYPLTVDFSGGPLEIKQNRFVFFSDLSVAAKGDEILSRQWEFPGGVPSTSNRQSPEVRYPDVGSYDVALTIKTVGGDSKTKTIENMVRTSPEYCEPQFFYTNYFHITNVKLNTIDHDLDPNNFDYFDKIETYLKPGGTYPISLTVSKGEGGETDVNRVRVWADQNRNGVYEEEELLISKVVNGNDFDSGDTYVINEHITIQEDAVLGKIGLRVLAHYVKKDDGDQPCDRMESGNAADYALNIISAPTVANAIADRTETEDFSDITLDLSNVFTDADNDKLTYTANSGDTDVVTIVVNNNNLVITYAGTGTSTITVTAADGNGKTVEDEFTVTVNPSTTPTEEERDMLIIYPNPSTGLFTYDWNGETNIVSWELFDIAGTRLEIQGVRSNVASSKVTIDVSGFMEGILFFRLQTSDGQSVLRRIILIK